MDANGDDPLLDKVIPTHVLMKIVNRRRRLLWLQDQAIPKLIEMRERVLLDMAVDDLCAWAEEHAPELFYRDKNGEVVE